MFDPSELQGFVLAATGRQQTRSTHHRQELLDGREGISY
jgi:hypothetical protein